MKNGHYASLNIKSEAGKASTALSLEIEHGLFGEPCTGSIMRSNARSRRRVRREMMQKDRFAFDETLNAMNSSDIAEEAIKSTNHVIADTTHSLQNDAEIETEEESTENVVNGDSIIRPQNTAHDNASENVVIDVDKDNGNSSKNSLDIPYVKEDLGKKAGVDLVHATVTIKSHKTQITKDEGSALINILKSKDHLRRNLKGVLYGTSETFKDDQGGYMHYWNITIHVDASNLWEKARSYVYHHLGRQSWTLNDGTEIQLKRIHQK